MAHQTQLAVQPNLVAVAVVPRQILLVKRHLMEAPLYTGQAEAEAEAHVALVLVRLAALGVTIPQAVEGQLVGLLMLEHPVVMDAEMAAAGQQGNKLVLEARAACLEAAGVAAGELLLMAQVVPMVVMAVVEPFESIVGR